MPQSCILGTLWSPVRTVSNCTSTWQGWSVPHMLVCPALMENNGASKSAWPQAAHLAVTQPKHLVPWAEAPRPTTSRQVSSWPLLASATCPLLLLHTCLICSASLWTCTRPPVLFSLCHGARSHSDRFWCLCREGLVPGSGGCMGWLCAFHTDKWSVGLLACWRWLSAQTSWLCQPQPGSFRAVGLQKSNSFYPRNSKGNKSQRDRDPLRAKCY